MGKASCGTAACLMLWARFFLLLATEQTAETASLVQCLNNYGFQGRRVDCRWHRNQALEGALFYLNFSDTLGLSSDLICPLSASPGTPDHFNCSVHSEEGGFTENDEYKVVLHVSSLGENQTDVIFVKYKPRLHIQCDPPFDLQSRCSDNTCRVCWKRPKACEEILEDWQWELAFKAVQDPWEVTGSSLMLPSTSCSALAPSCSCWHWPSSCSRGRRAAAGPASPRRPPSSSLSTWLTTGISRTGQGWPRRRRQWRFLSSRSCSRPPALGQGQPSGAHPCQAKSSGGECWSLSTRPVTTAPSAGRVKGCPSYPASGSRFSVLALDLRAARFPSVANAKPRSRPGAGPVAPLLWEGRSRTAA